ncbi:MAG: 4Fe-4S dicluster protein, partial [Anaerolineales bacterium]|nr:4Fe-4S dicluster protein [Anaerolineales bacterium]
MTQESLGRRNFLKVLAAGITAAVGLRLARKPAQASEPVGSIPHQWAMVIDQSKCIGCGYCTLACR